MATQLAKRWRLDAMADRDSDDGASNARRRQRTAFRMTLAKKLRSQFFECRVGGGTQRLQVDSRWPVPGMGRARTSLLAFQAFTVAWVDRTWFRSWLWRSRPCSTLFAPRIPLTWSRPLLWGCVLGNGGSVEEARWWRASRC